ncbi:hypothetical protein HMPREF0083_02826 [Aneurinibacillus aneurinilyticus ATCC 12856]|uniref:Uncharacterized protein n=1 Tax=Aneurinibacillus aneurinilyticus ATCC 12856 TaxID=649747 RepID=U1X3B6_ANEAE|nr:hypothetical protein HMPREF0083_02826 [Aneurinibacillus aneurinilyticus ATCC 12856]
MCIEHDETFSFTTRILFYTLKRRKRMTSIIIMAVIVDLIILYVIVSYNGLVKLRN